MEYGIRATLEGITVIRVRFRRAIGLKLGLFSIGGIAMVLGRGHIDVPVQVGVILRVGRIKCASFGPKPSKSLLAEIVLLGNQNRLFGGVSQMPSNCGVTVSFFTSAWTDTVLGARHSLGARVHEV
ncbi:hypothetical protein C8R46DRAFT_1037316 [Mycena filopes]|nr:hypothetical protein C8R46DRAFT_1037316 [Mycena filopes]